MKKKVLGLSLVLGLGFAIGGTSLLVADQATTNNGHAESQFTGSFCQGPAVDCLPATTPE